MQQRFDIPGELLEQLIHGTAMDIQADGVDREATDGLSTFGHSPIYISIVTTSRPSWDWCAYGYSVTAARLPRDLPKRQASRSS